MPWGLTPAHLIIILVIVLIVVGPGKLPDTGAAIGKALRGFKDAMETGEDPTKTAQPPVPPAQVPMQPPVQYPPAQAPVQYAPPQPAPVYQQPVSAAPRAATSELALRGTSPTIVARQNSKRSPGPPPTLVTRGCCLYLISAVAARDPTCRP
jgi:sec-independent protein translocase protein TatA